MYRFEMREVGLYDKNVFLFDDFSEASDFICLALGRSERQLEVTITEVKGEQ